MMSRSPAKASLTAARRCAAYGAAGDGPVTVGRRGAQSSATNARNSSVVGRARFSACFCSSLVTGPWSHDRYAACSPPPVTAAPAPRDLSATPRDRSARAGGASGASGRPAARRRGRVRAGVRVGRAVVGHRLRLPLGPDPLTVEVDLLRDGASSQPSTPAMSWAAGSWPRRRHGPRPRSRCGCGGPARRRGAGHPRATPRTRSRRAGSPPRRRAAPAALDAAATGRGSPGSGTP